MFHFTWFRVIGPMNSSQCVLADGFPHSEILESTPDCGSSRLIAAYRVLHRLLTPRHSPFTLTSLEKIPASFAYVQFSKNPTKKCFVVFLISDSAKLVGLTGLEPVTLRLSSACSNQLSYRPIVQRGGAEEI